MRRKRHDGHDLDSALTEPILKIIEDKYAALYNSHGEEISSDFLEKLKNDNILLNSFVERLADKVSGKISKKARAKIVHLLVEQIHDAATSNTSHIVGQHISHFASTAVGGADSIGRSACVAQGNRDEHGSYHCEISGKRSVQESSDGAVA
jgi:hypothetical protein